jgi:hypothetical protein
MTTKTKFYVPVELSLNELIQLGIVKNKQMTPKIRKALYKYIFTEWHLKNDVSYLYKLADKFGSIPIIPINDSEHILLPTNTKEDMDLINDWLSECFKFVQWDEIEGFFSYIDVDEHVEDMFGWTDNEIKKFLNEGNMRLISIDRLIDNPINTPQGGILFESLYRNHY